MKVRDYLEWEIGQRNGILMEEWKYIDSIETALNNDNTINPTIIWI
jgi:hypothetical protein